MELAPILKSQIIQNRVREVGINPNYWYPVAWADQVLLGKIMSVVIWQQVIAIYRGQNSKIHALENVCPHKGVALHKGEVQGDNLVCPYHGWQFNSDGKCIHIPYLPKGQKLPCAEAKSYPTQEKYNIIWVFPGDEKLAEGISIPDIPEYDNPEWLKIPIPARFKAHFSICNENTMDVFHGFLHKDLQGWFNPVLLKLSQNQSSVQAEYQVSYQGWITKFLGLSQPRTKITTRTISIKYEYPHYHSSLEGISSIYLMRLPLGIMETQSFSLLFLKIGLPKWILIRIKPQLSQAIWRFLFKKFLDQDLEMVESEQRSYLANPERRYVEINPAIIALQRVIVGQYEYFMQQSRKLLNHNHRKGE
ncbi:FIG00566093: hypothetical protein [Richelia intracellularis HH01]|uniref:Rieske domain-containing protein n=1 Tax=Richelia intracellularis HH01 TaxID=1165094 RepID=M1X648_9NOST|nr:aromatic ring-hydroxylating dioxygenase subunit alpha [Richelia intracellularis]CCH67871.1 FIG00566093: hypothetical protein [Richelia intracellularis HH01]